jgi:mercuric ion transport protein
MARSIARSVFPWLAWIFAGCLVVQVFLAGLGAFGTADGFAPHRQWAYTFGYLILVNIVVAIVAGLPRRLVGLTALAAVLFILQSVLVALRDVSIGIAAIHPVNGFLILLVALVVARDATALRRSPDPTEPSRAAADSAAVEARP